MQNPPEPHQIERVLIVEDHVQAGELLAQLALKLLPDSTQFVAKNIKQATAFVQNQQADLVILDLGLPDGNGIDLIPCLLDQARPPLIIVTTIFDDEVNLFEALKAGANGYLLKGHSEEELERFIGEAIQGRPALSPSIAQSVLRYFHEHNDQQIHEPENVYEKQHLTDRETEILTFIAKGFKVKEIGGLLGVTNNTVSAHVKSIYRKLNLHNRAEATAAAVSLKLYQP